MAQKPNYKAGKNTTATLGGTVLAVTGGSWDTTTEFDDATNTKSGGYKSSVPTIRELTGSLDCVYDGDDPPLMKDGDYLEGCTVTCPGGPGFTADLWVDKISRKTVDVRGKVSFTVDFHSEGAFLLS